MVTDGGGAGPRPGPDPWPLRIILVALSVIAVLSVAGTIALATQGHDTPPLLATLAATSIGALAGMAPPVRRPGPPANGGPSDSTIMRR